MSRPPRAPSPGRTKRLSQIHRAAGVSAGGALLYLLATGLPLQFSPELDLGRRTATHRFVLDWYGLQAPSEVLTSNGVVAVGSLTYWAGTRIGDAAADGDYSDKAFIGAVRLNDLVVVATADSLIVFPAATPQLVERQPQREPLHGIAVVDERLHVLAESRVRRFDPALLNSEVVTTPAESIPWEQPQPASSAIAARHQELFRQQMLSLERVFQDLHSGRFFGPVGVWVVNLATLLLLALALSGYLIWWRSRRA